MTQSEVHVQNQFSDETLQKLALNRPRDERGLPVDFVNRVLKSFLEQVSSKSPLTAVDIPSKSGMVTTFFPPDEVEMNQIEELHKELEDLKADQQTHPSRTQLVGLNKAIRQVSGQLEGIVGSLSYSHKLPVGLSEELIGSPVYKNLQEEEPANSGINSLPTVAAGAIALSRPHRIKNALIAFEAAIIIAGCTTGEPQIYITVHPTTDGVTPPIVQETKTVVPSSTPEPVKSTVTSLPNTPEVVQNPKNMITRALFGKVLANMGGSGIFIPDQQTVSGDGGVPTKKIKAIDLEELMSHQWRTEVGLNQAIVKSSNAVDAIRWISGIANLRGLKIAEKINTRDLLGQSPDHEGYDIFRFRSSTGDRLLRDSVTPEGFILREGARVQVLGQYEGRIALVVSDFRDGEGYVSGSNYFVTLSTDKFTSTFTDQKNGGSVEQNPDGSTLLRASNDVVFTVPLIENNLAQEIQKDSGIYFVDLIAVPRGLNEHPNPVVPYPPNNIVSSGTTITKIEVDQSDYKVYAFDKDGNKLASVSYDRNTEQWTWAIAAPPPTQTPEPTALIIEKAKLKTNAIMYAGPDNANFKQLAQLKIGSPLTSSATYGDFVQVTDENGTVGYILKSTLATLPNGLPELTENDVPWITIKDFTGNGPLQLENPGAETVSESVGTIQLSGDRVQFKLDFSGSDNGGFVQFSDSDKTGSELWNATGIKVGFGWDAGFITIYNGKSEKGNVYAWPFPADRKIVIRYNIGKNTISIIDSSNKTLATYDLSTYAGLAKGLFPSGSADVIKIARPANTLQLSSLVAEKSPNGKFFIPKPTAVPSTPRPPATAIPPTATEQPRDPSVNYEVTIDGCNVTRTNFGLQGLIYDEKDGKFHGMFTGVGGFAIKGDGTSEARVKVKNVDIQNNTITVYTLDSNRNIVELTLLLNGAPLYLYKTAGDFYDTHTGLYAPYQCLLPNSQIYMIARGNQVLQMQGAK